MIALVLVGTGVIGSNLAKGKERADETSHSFIFAFLAQDKEVERPSVAPKNTASRALTVATVATTQPELFTVEQNKDQPNFSAQLSGEVITKPVLATVKDVEKRTAREFAYAVQPGDTISSIANKFDISVATLQVANNLPINATLKTGQPLQILPVNGVAHRVQDSESVAQVVTQYNGDLEQTLALNKIENANDPLVKDSLLVVVGGSKAVPAPIPTPTPTPAPATQRPSLVRVARAATQNNDDAITIRYGGGGHRFAYGYCTYWAAKRRGGVPWSGNANQWINGAHAFGYKTGKTPVAGAIYAEPWLTGYGHVSYVEKVNPDGSFTVSEMNYAGWNRVSYRTIGSPAGTFIY